MQNKLNEIVELCIEKSNHQIGYYFHYNPNQRYVHIEKFDHSVQEYVPFNNGAGYEEGKMRFDIHSNLSGVIEAMQNE